MDVRNYLFGKTTRTLVYKSLDANMMKQRAIANNIANVNTEGYLRKEVSFEDRLQGILDKKIDADTPHSRHIEMGKAAAIKAMKPLAYEANDKTLPGEINNVDIDLEMSKLAENQIQYQFGIRFSGFDGYLAAISGQAR